MSHRKLPLYPSLSLPYSTTSSLLLSGRQGGDWRKKASLNPIPNPQQALKHMNGGGPAAAAAVTLSRSERYFLFPAAAATAAAVTEAAERSWCTGKSRKRRSATTACPALCALHPGEPSHTASAPLLPSLPQLVYGGRFFYLCYDLPDAALLKRLSFPVTLSLSVSPRERQRGDGGRGGCCCCCW